MESSEVAAKAWKSGRPSNQTAGIIVMASSSLLDLVRLIVASLDEAGTTRLPPEDALA